MSTHSFYDSDTGKQVFGKGTYSGGAVYGNGTLVLEYQEFNNNRGRYDPIITEGHGSIIANQFGNEDRDKYFLSERVKGGGGFLIAFKPVSGPFDTWQEIVEMLQVEQTVKYTVWGCEVPLENGFVVVAIHKDKELYFYDSKQEAKDASEVLNWALFNTKNCQSTVESMIDSWYTDQLESYT